MELCCGQCPQPCRRPLWTAATTAGDAQTLTGKSGSLSFGVTAPFSWVLVRTRFGCAELLGKILEKNLDHLFPGDPFESSKLSVICLYLFQVCIPHINLLKRWVHMPNLIIPYLTESLIISIHYSLSTDSYSNL